MQRKRTRRPIGERFWEKVDMSGGEDACWTWTAGTCSGGYGSFNIAGRQYKSHRLSYEWMVGPIPAGLQLDHLCRVRNCVNPRHLEPVTQRENIMRGIVGDLVAREYCDCGAPMTGANVYVRGTTGRRECRACIRRRNIEYRKRSGRTPGGLLVR